MARTQREVLDHHLEALLAQDVDELLVDYTDDAALITAAGVARGKDAIRAAFGQLAGALAGARFDVKTQTFHDDTVLMEWLLDSPAARVDGVDTFVFDGELIRIQTISQVVQPRGADSR